MERISRYILIAIAIIVASLFIPDFYRKATEKNIRAPFATYSSVNKDFIIFRRTNADIKWVDTKGNKYTLEEYEKLVPLTYYRQLLADGTMPDTIDGIAIDTKELQKNRIHFRFKPKQLDVPSLGLYPLFESASGRVSLSLPTDMFRIVNSGIEFLDAQTNTLNVEKSETFTKQMKSAGFVFPAKWICGNPSVRKAYDEGYFIKDSNNAIYHLKMAKGVPVIHNTAIESDKDIITVIPYEVATHEFYGFAIGKDNSFYVLSTDNYKLIKLPVENFNAKESSLQVFGNLMYRNIIVTNKDNMHCYVTNRDYKLVDEYHETWKTAEETTAGKAAEYLFPLTINMTSKYSSVINPVSKYSLLSIPFNIIVLIVYIVLLIRRKSDIKLYIPEIIIIVFTGWLGLIAIAMFPKARRMKQSMIKDSSHTGE